MVCVSHFDFEMCFAPQWRAFFRHLNFQKCSQFFGIRTSKGAPNLKCFVHVHLEMCFVPKRRRALFNLWTSKSCPNMLCLYVLVAFSLRHVLRTTTASNFSSLISPDGSAPAALASLLFDPPEPQNIGKTQCFATFYLVAPLHLPSSDSFSSLIFFPFPFSSRSLPTSAFHLSIVSEARLLNLLWSWRYHRISTVNKRASVGLHLPSLIVH